ncbi:12631_t:CDS:2 [Cetraspora pellucida]|uniref:12631_t:CDS:1 n=1 Tax=Cetraspora pellucida TaxID=1433469 RepID=A0A9N9DHI7_9GLOM|nr:12631_t:CDS:2 [Cetraspora pellucida]
MVQLYRDLQEINEIIASTIPENTHKATAKWVKILESWRSEVGYDYGVETINDRQQLEHEMIEFILGIKQIRTQSEYSPLSLINCIRLLSVYIFKHPESTNKFNINNRKEFPQLWEALNGKMKHLKRQGIVSRHHDHLTDDELKQIFQHSALSIDHPEGLLYRIFM